MARINEQIRRVRLEMQGQPDSTIMAAISELNRREASIVVKGMSVVPVLQKARDWRDALLETSSGKMMVQAKLQSEQEAEARVRRQIEIADRIRQLKALVHDVFVVQPRSAEPVNGWVPRVRFDIYQQAKETCRKLGQAGGAEYDRVLTAVKYAGTSSKDYRDAIEALLGK